MKYAELLVRILELSLLPLIATYLFGWGRPYECPAVKPENAKIFNRKIGLTPGTDLGLAFMIGWKIIRNAAGISLDSEFGCLPL